MRKKIFTILLILIILLTSYIVALLTMVAATTINGINYISNMSSSAYDIRGIINGSTELKTTYSNAGYQVYFKVDNGEEQSVTNISNGGSITVDGLTLRITGSSGSGTSVNVIYEVINNTSTQKSYQIATTADVMLGSNDKAAILKNGGTSLTLTQDNANNTADYGAQITLYFSPSATTSWIGRYSDRNANKYVNGTVNSYTYVESIDTGMAFSWSGTVAGNSSKTYTSGFSTQLAANGSVNFYRYNSNTIDSTATALIGGTVVPPTLSSATGYTYTWNTRRDGTGTNYTSSQGIIVTANNMSMYEVRTPNVYAISLNNQSANTAGTTTIYQTYATKYSLTNNRKCNDNKYK